MNNLYRYALRLVALTPFLLLFAPLSWAEREGVLIYVNDPYLELRTGPGRGYPIIQVVEKGMPVRLVKRRTDWYKVIAEKEGQSGWVQREQLSNTLTDSGEPADFSLSGWQEYLDKTVEMGIAGGQFGNADAVSVYLAWHWTPNISVEANFMQSFSSRGNNRLATVNIVHQAFPEWRLSPYFKLGSGIVYIDPSATLVQVEDRDESVVTVGTGLRSYIGRRFLVRLEYNNHTLLTQRAENREVDEWKLGFAAFF